MKTKLPLQASLSLLFMSPILTNFAQQKELSLGISSSSYSFDNQKQAYNWGASLPGFQVGYLFRPKINLFKKNKNGVINPYMNLEYAFSNCTVKNLDLPIPITLHQLRFSLPLRIRIAQTEKKRFSYYVMGEPGIQLNALQQNYKHRDIPKFEPFDTYLNVGVGFTHSRKIREIKKAGYKFIGVTMNASRMIPLNSFRFSENQGSFHQYRVNIGLKYSYLEPKRVKKRLFMW